MSIPGNAWGSVLGNALERGLGYTPYGDNAAQLCALRCPLDVGTFHELEQTGNLAHPELFT
jgi:4-cresol dehydrogenase (hydroxylating)